MDPMMVKEEHHEGDYGNEQWMVDDYHSQHTHSPNHDYAVYGYMSSSHVPLAPAYSRPMPSSYSSHQQPPPLITAQWPSMLTNPSSNTPPPLQTQTSSGPPQLAPLAPLTTYNPPPLPPVATPMPAPNTRRTLTDQDRRRMCQYHEENPTVKQTEIGAMFGVERSTVSKVLRQKEKYLFQDDGSRSPIKRSKGKFPDIERALANWARNHQKQGLPLNDSIIRDKARFFATTVGSSESHLKMNSNSWLEKFKQKNHLLGCKPPKTAEGNESDGTNGLNPDSNSGSQTPNGISPVSPPAIGSPSPISPNRGREGGKNGSPDSYLDFSSSYRHTHSQSATSLASCFSETTAPSSFSGGPTSPTSPFFSPDPNSGSFSPAQHSQMMNIAAANTARPRSQTFPLIGVETGFMSNSHEPLTPKYLQQIMASPALETPVEELSEHTLSLDSSVQHSHNQHSTGSSTPNQNSSPSSMAPPPLPSSTSTPATSNTTSPIASPPSQDEARRALELVMNFFQHQPHGLMHPQEYHLMEKLMEKLKLEDGLGELPGGMHSMHVGAKEMGRKRSIHSL
ncbi:MAG: hypothetical protein MMC33_007266 [Icmadophila ericetorum]|nr:hypothetical protein [Icmadophila ericetorum]